MRSGLKTLVLRRFCQAAAPKAEECPPPEPKCETTETNKPCPKQPPPPPPPPKEPEKPPEPPERCAPKAVKKVKPKPPDMGQILVDGENPTCEPLSAKYLKSFAYVHMSERLPKVVDSITRQMMDINGVSPILKKKFGYGEPLQREVMETAQEMEELKGHVRTGLPLEPLTSKLADLKGWNEDLLKAKSDGKDNYYSGDWLFTEAYFYRKIHDILMSKKFLCFWDPLQPQRQELLKSSLAQMVYKMNDIVGKGILGPEPRDLRRSELLHELGAFLKLSLWANRNDLSVQTGDPSLLDMGLVDQWDNKILVNDTLNVFNFFCPETAGDDSFQNRIIDIFVDNCGMELVSDMLLADFLVSRMHVDLVRFHVKKFPFYVSDVVFTDVPYTIDFLLKLKNYKSIYSFAQRWRDYTKEGRWLWSCEPFLTMGRPFQRLKETDEDLLSNLGCATMAIYKGDLNFRRLLGDMNWPPGTTLKQAMGDYKPCPTLVLRTNKAQLMAGLPESTAAEVFNKSPDWMTSGEYGLIMFQC